MNNFCTLFDTAYLSRGLLLYDSLKHHAGDFHLYIVPFDDTAYNILCSLNQGNMTIIPLNAFENERLLNIKKSRTRAEYFWTCTSSVIEFVLTTFKLNSCTYLDADLYFYSAPDQIFKECNESENVVITEHRYSWLARLYEGNRAGRFCVQFVTFTSSEKSIIILKKWIDQCIDWCYDRYEDGKFGDQKYLDEWPSNPNVHIVSHPGAGIAPWNVNNFKFFWENDKRFGKYKLIVFEVIFFHFHYVRFNNDGTADLGWNRLSGNVKDLFYKPYIKELLLKEDFLEASFKDYKRIFSKEIQSGIKNYIKRTLKRLFRYNIIDFSKI